MNERTEIKKIRAKEAKLSGNRVCKTILEEALKPDLEYIELREKRRVFLIERAKLREERAKKRKEYIERKISQEAREAAFRIELDKRIAIKQREEKLRQVEEKRLKKAQDEIKLKTTEVAKKRIVKKELAEPVAKYHLPTSEIIKGDSAKVGSVYEQQALKRRPVQVSNKSLDVKPVVLIEQKKKKKKKKKKKRKRKNRRKK